MFLRGCVFSLPLVSLVFVDYVVTGASAAINGHPELAGLDVTVSYRGLARNEPITFTGCLLVTSTHWRNARY